MRQNLIFSIAAAAALLLAGSSSWAEEEMNPAAMAKALQQASLPLEKAPRSASDEGKPISAKYEIENGALQLSIYTMKGDRFSELIVDHKSGAVAKDEWITDGDDLKAAQAQAAAMAKAKLTLDVATDNAVKANAGYRAVSVVPKLDRRPAGRRRRPDEGRGCQEGNREARLRRNAMRPITRLVTTAGCRRRPRDAGLRRRAGLEPGRPGARQIRRRAVRRRLPRGLPAHRLKVSLDGVALDRLCVRRLGRLPADGQQAMVMGDLVLTQDEVNPVMRKLEEGGIEITALHNHLLRAEPMTLYMHVQGHGDPVKLAAALHAGLALSKTPFRAAAGHAPRRQHRHDRHRPHHGVFGAKGTDNGGIYQFGIPRAEPIKERHGPAGRHGRGDRHQLPADRRRQGGHHRRLRADRQGGQPCDQGAASNGIEVTALHSHMLDEQPRALLHAFLGQ